MKRFLVTEEERKHIMKLYENLNDNITSEQAASPRGQETKKLAAALSELYLLRLNTTTTGNWNDSIYNSYLTGFMKANNISHFTCKKGLFDCNDDEEGLVKTYEFWTFQYVVKNVLKIDIDASVLFPVKSSNAQTTGTQTTGTQTTGTQTTGTQTTGTQTNSSTTTQPKEFPFEYPNDKNYRYAHHQGKWFAKNVKTGKVFDLTLNPKFQSSINNLNKQFADKITFTDSRSSNDF
jgi:hypothetical protein